MIVGRPQKKSERNQQAYLMEEISPLTSQLVMDILETKPADPIPKMYNILTKIVDQRQRDKDDLAKRDKGEELLDGEWEDYKKLLDRKRELLAELDCEVIDLEAILSKETYK